MGALRVLERCPQRALPTVVAGIEIKYLRVLGLLPDLGSCSACGRSDSRLFAAPGGQGLVCSEHTTGNTRAISGPALRALRTLDVTPGRDWATLPPLEAAARSLLGRWIATAIERAPRWRGHAMSPGRSETA